MRQAGLVEGRLEGRETYYRARSEGLAPLIDWLGVYGVFWRDRIDALSDLLDRMDISCYGGRLRRCGVCST
ncbi:ArsR family transcriptional regulator [Burkholderia lata]|nr:ArsR family transcriptional regulator [Burkholderia lata]